MTRRGSPAPSGCGAKAPGSAEERAPRAATALDHGVPVCARRHDHSPSGSQGGSTEERPGSAGSTQGDPGLVGSHGPRVSACAHGIATEHPARCPACPSPSALPQAELSDPRTEGHGDRSPSPQGAHAVLSQPSRYTGR